VVFFDKKSSGQCKQMGAIRSPAVDATWSPDGRHLLTAITAPRLRVDNGIKLFTYYGAYPTLLPIYCLPLPPFPAARVLVVHAMVRLPDVLVYRVPTRPLLHTSLAAPR
jgi:hypothetical protein